MITTNSKVAALASAVALVGMVLLAPAAHAQTMSTTTTTTTSGGTTMTSTMSAAAMQQEIASLQAQLAASQGTSMMTGSSALFTMDLTTGSTGSQVTALQSWLISKGYSIPAGATGYFGSQTTAALAAYQAANGISPAVGYFGPITRAHVNATGGSTTTTTTSTVAGCVAGAMYSSTTGQACGTTTTTTTGGSTSLTGGEGSVNNFQTIGASNVTLGTGASQQVYGFQFQAGGSDLNVSRIYFDIANIAATGTSRPWNIFQTATLTNSSGQTVATLDATNQANYSEDGTVTDGPGVGNQIYRLDFENVNQVVKMNSTQSYYLTFTTQGAFATNNAGGSYAVALANQGLRATDAMGLQEYSPSNTAVFGSASSGSTILVNNNATGSVTLSTGSDNPQTTTLMANQNTSTQGVVLNTFTLDNTGSGSIELYTLPVIVTATGTAQTANLVQSLMLYQGSTLLDTESPVSGNGNVGTTTFKNLNVVIPAGTTDSFRIVANIQPVGGNNPAANGSGVTVTVPSNGADIEAAGGAILTVSGASTGYPITFAVNGLSVASSPSTATASATLASGGNGTQQTGTFTFVFNVTAFGQTIYVPSNPTAYTLNVIDQTANSATSTANVSSGITSTANRSGLGNFQVNSGQTATFTITATLSHGGNSHYYYATLNSLVYGVADSAPNTATTTLPSNYTTNAVSVSS
jgi:peptidoglycan hydrolase-like protein with peptidoglycan-binding domain